MSGQAEYVTMLWDINKSRPVYMNKENKLSFTAKGGVSVRVPFAPERIASMSFLDMANTMPVEPIQVDIYNLC